MQKVRHRVLAVLLSLAITVIAVGCGKGSSDSNSSAGNTNTGKTEEVKVEMQPIVQSGTEMDVTIVWKTPHVLHLKGKSTLGSIAFKVTGEGVGVQSTVMTSGGAYETEIDVKNGASKAVKVEAISPLDGKVLLTIDIPQILK